ncbi:hypothetical protein [Actinoplanes sp. NPDC026670]|uniref:hypothetical protein n=1 Tax=Actinoplanes sp. NPDC026670 TaxID=3154700 RepID=UPI0034011A1F
MTEQSYSGIFIGEGSSDMPISEIVESLFFDRGITLHLSKPDFGLLGKVAKDVRSRILAGEKLNDGRVDLIVVHRDADNAGIEARRAEISNAAEAIESSPTILPVIPVRMTEAWLLLDEQAIRTVAGNPRGRADLELPKWHEVESHADPKNLLNECLLKAADVSGRRRERIAKRFNQNRRQLLERLDKDGPVTKLGSWKNLVHDIEIITEDWLAS